MQKRKNAKKIIKCTVKKSITEFAKKKLKSKAKFQILDLIIPKERKIRSIVGGLETSLGTTLWEPLAKALATENGFKIVEKNLMCPANMPAALGNLLQGVLEDRKRNGGLYDGKSSHQAIKGACRAFIARPIERFEPAPRGHGVDIWLIKDEVNYFFDTKTVQPNLGGFTKYMEQILTWYAYFYSKFPEGNAEARLVFPYNPTKGQDFWEKSIGNGRPLEPHTEGWVENQFWDFCSGLENTYELIEECFKELRESQELDKVFDKLLNNN